MNIKGVLAVLMIVGTVLASIPLAAGAAFSSEGIRFVHFLWMIPGLIFVILSVIGLVFASLYVRAKGNVAYVRTGKGGRKVILDHGSLVIGFLHEIIPVSLETLKIVVERKGKESLITLDKLRAEVVAEFYIRVKADEDGIATAARTLGDKISTSTSGGKRDNEDGRSIARALENAINQLEKEKLIDALRTVGAKSALEDLNLKRDEFKKSVMAVVQDGLAKNGLELEDCTISALDQAPMEIMDKNNSFDAQGLKNLQQIISAQSVARNEFERTAELEIKKKDVETETAVLAQDQDLKFKTADQGREVRAYSAEQDKLAREAELQSEEAIGRRAIEKDQAISVSAVKSEEEVATKEVEKEKAIEITRVEKQKAVETANVEKQKAVETAEVEKQKTVEVAQRDQEIAITQKETEKAAEEEKLQQANALAEKASQEVQNVSVLETATRAKEEAIIGQQAISERDLIETQKQADANAYKVTKEAEGREKAAEADYQAKTKAAEADFIQKSKAAEGRRAEEMVPVEVDAERVKVEKDRVETVLRPELAVKAEHQQISVELTLGQLRIEAEEKVGVAMAGALGLMMSSAKMNIYGDPETLTTMTDNFMSGHSLSQSIEGFMKGGAMEKLMPFLKAVAEKTGIEIPDDEKVEPAAAEETPAADTQE